jgi:predicted transcriptional regulator
MLSESMIEILRLLNEFGYCDIRHIAKRFDIKKTIAYENMRVLIKYGLVMNARIIKYQPRAYYLTSKGADLLKLDLPLIRRIPLNIYEHQLAVIDVFLKLREMHPEAVWISERRLIRDKYSSDSKMDDHLPDGALAFPQGYKCAIEVEMTLKARDRLRDILFRYGLQDTYKEVWYFCSKSVLPVLRELASGLPYIQIYNLSETLL